MAYTESSVNAYSGGSVKKKQNSDGTVTRYYGTTAQQAPAVASNQNRGTTGAKRTGSAGGTDGLDTANLGGLLGYSYLDAVRAIYEEQLAAQQAARRAAYDTAVAQQRSNYNFQVGQVNSAADKALREAYINKLQSLRVLPQTMAAQGYSGGMTESSTAGLLNNYGNSRNKIETGRGDNIAGLGNTLQNNLAGAANILQQGVAGDYAAYYTNLAKLMADNLPDLVSLQQGGMASGGGGTQAALSAYVSDADSIAQSLAGAGYTAAQIRAVLNSMGLE